MSGAVARPGWWRANPRVAGYSPAQTDSTDEKEHRFPFWALVAFTLIMILTPQNYLPFLKPLHLAMVSGALASGAYLLGRFSGTAGRVRKSRAVVLALLLFLWAVALVPFSLWPGGSYAKIFGIFAKALIIFWLLGRVVNSGARLRIMAWTLCLVSVPLSLSAVSGFLHLGAANINVSHGWERITGYDGGLTDNPNDLALMINLTLPFTMGLLLTARKITLRFALAALVLLDVIAVVFTYSRGGFLTLLAIVGAYLWCLPRRARRGMAVAIVGIGLVAVPVIPSGYWSRLSTITDIQADRTDSAQQRWAGMVDATHLVISHPVIGAGAGMDLLALNPLTGDSWLHVHDIYLEYAVDLGLPGLLIFLLLYSCVLKSAWAARRRSRGREETNSLYHLSESVWVALVAFGVSATFQPVAYEFYFYYMAGLAVAAGSIASQYASVSPDRGMTKA